MTLPTNSDIDAAVPTDGEPSRALVNAVFKQILEMFSFLPDGGTIPTRSIANENFSGGRLKAALGTDPDDCVNVQQLNLAIPTFSTLSGVPAALTSPQAAGTASIRAIGTGATQAAAGNHTHGAASASASGFMTAAQFTKLGGLPPFKQALTKPEAIDSAGQQFEFFIDDDGFYLCISENNWRMWSLMGW